MNLSLQRRPGAFPWRAASAFSLVEVVMSLGILSFAMVALLGMIPLGLSTFRDAMNITVESQIAQSLSSDLQLTDFSNLKPDTRYYNEQGAEAEAGSEECIYTVWVTPQALQSPAHLLPAQAVQSVRISIWNRTAPTTTNSYSVIVFNNNR